MISEYVTLGHPDKVADFISCALLDDCIKRDPTVRFAIEVQIKGKHVCLGGELTMNNAPTPDEMRATVRAAVNQIGYTAEYKRAWNGCVVCGDELDVDIYVTRQSPDISIGVDHGGWGDQGIFFGLAVRGTYNTMPFDTWLARQIGMRLPTVSPLAGLDCKVLVDADGIDEIHNVTVAQPAHDEKEVRQIEDVVIGVMNRLVCEPENLTVDGTGVYRQHGPLADCGTTGRKLACDFYGGNSPIGGGSPWTKDGTKADLTLNLYARALAIMEMRKHNLEECRTAIRCSIGSPVVSINVTDQHGWKVDKRTVKLFPRDLIMAMKLDGPVFRQLCMDGLPYYKFDFDALEVEEKSV